MPRRIIRSSRPTKDSPTRNTRKILGVSDVTKIIVFRNTEGGTTAFDKTFSTIRSYFPPSPPLPRLPLLSFPLLSFSLSLSLSLSLILPHLSLDCPEFSFRLVLCPSPANTLQAERTWHRCYRATTQRCNSVKTPSGFVSWCIAMHCTLQTAPCTTPPPSESTLSATTTIPPPLPLCHSVLSLPLPLSVSLSPSLCCSVRVNNAYLDSKEWPAKLTRQLYFPVHRSFFFSLRCAKNGFSSLRSTRPVLFRLQSCFSGWRTRERHA